MSEVPRLPDYGDGDNSGREWSMDPNEKTESTELVVAGQNQEGNDNAQPESTDLTVFGGDAQPEPTDLTVYGGGDQPGSTELAPYDGGAGGEEEDDTEDDGESDEGGEGGETGEDGESELDRALDANYSADIFKAARQIGKPIENAMDVFDWSDEDKQRLLDALANLNQADGGTSSAEGGDGTDGDGAEDGDGEGDDEAGDGEGDGTEGGDGDGNSDAGEGAGRAAAVVEATDPQNPEGDDGNGNNGDGGNGGNGGDGGNGGTPEGGAGGEEEDGTESDDNNGPEQDPGKKRRRKIAASILAVAAALGLGALIWTNSGNNENKESEPSTTSETDDQSETGEENESLRILDNYDYYNNIEAKHSNVSWMNAADLVADLANDGKIQITSNSEGKLVFADKDAAYRTILDETFRMNPEQAGSIMGFGRHADLFESFLNEGTVKAGEQAIENMTEEQQQMAIEEWRNALEHATFEEVIWQGDAENCYIKDKTGDNHIIGRGDAEACRVTSNENGRKVLKITFENGKTMYMKINLDDADIQASRDGFVVVLKDANGKEYRYCAQDIEEKGGPVTKDTPKDDEKPDPERDDDDDEDDDDHTPPVDDDDPTPPKPVPPEDDDDDPSKPDPEPPADESKTQFDQKKVEEGLDGLHVDQQDQDGTLTDEKPTIAHYNEETNNDGSTGKENNVVAPDSDVQVGAQDTTELSADDSGRTVEQTIADADTTGGAGNENTGAQENRTEEDAAQHAADEAGHVSQEGANNNEDRTAADETGAMSQSEFNNAISSETDGMTPEEFNNWLDNNDEI